jgi:recombinational DNA repair protein RecT
MAEKAKGNQSENEFFAVATTGRKGVEDMLAKLGPELSTVAAPTIRKDFDTWTKRALVEISSRTELADVLQTRKGLFSIYRGLVKFATMGLQIGGHFPHAYFMPKAGEAVPVVTAEGFSFSAAHGPGAVLTYPPELVRVYEQDKLVIDQAAGMVKQHDVSPFGERGKLIGWYMKLQYIDGHVEISFITAEKVDDINKMYSTKETSTGKTMPAWAKSPEEMRDKTAAKQLLKKPAKEAEGLAMALTADDVEEEPSADVRDRVSARMGAVDAKFEIGPPPAPEPAAPPKAEPAPPAAETKSAEGQHLGADGKPELF